MLYVPALWAGGGEQIFFFMTKICLKTPAHVLKTHVRRMSYGGEGGVYCISPELNFNKNKFNKNNKTEIEK